MTKWFNGLQSLRGLLFIMIFVSHSGSFIQVFGNLGGMGVSSFFVLSGFLSSYKYKRSFANMRGVVKEAVNEIFHNLKKFYLLYFVFLVVALLINPGSSTKWEFIKCLLLIQSYFGNARSALAFNWPTWFLSSILICYFCSPFINRSINRIKNNTSVLVGIMFFALILMVAWNYHWRSFPKPYGPGYYYVYIFPLARLIDFALGSIIGILYKNYENRKDYQLVGNQYDLIETFVVIAFFGMQIYNKFAPKITIYTVLWIPISLCLVWIFADEKGFITKNLSKFKLLLWLGDISFELYICHRMVLLFYSRYGNSTMLWIYAIITTIIVAQCSARLRKNCKTI